MLIKESGIIIFMEDYEKSLDFYVSILGLSIRERKCGLAILNFGKSYLMVEDNGVASRTEKSRAQNPTVLRLDVEDFEGTICEIRNRGGNITIRTLVWGTIGVIIDPEGNRIEIKKIT